MFLSVLLWASIRLAADTNEIGVAVGVTLGQPFPVSIRHSTNMVPGQIGYRFSPTNAPKPFKEFIAGISVKSHVVYLIYSQLDFDSSEEGRLEYEKIRLLLIEKYGKPQFEDQPVGGTTETLWKQGVRGISLRYDSRDRNRLMLNYADTALLESARREYMETKTANVDRSGL